MLHVVRNHLVKPSLQEVARYGNKGKYPPIAGGVGYVLGQKSSTTSNCTTAAWASSVTSGDLLVLGLFNSTSSSATISSITDTVGTSYSSYLFGSSAHGSSYAIAYGLAGGTGANSSAITWSTGTAGAVIWGEFSGAPGAIVIDGAGVKAEVTSGTVTTPTITTTMSDDLVLHLARSGNTMTVGSPWTVVVTVANNIALAYQADVTAGTYTPNMTCTSAAWTSLCVAIGPMQKVVPDADNATTGWATAPLYSKVNDGSDSTVITNTI